MPDRPNPLVVREVGVVASRSLRDGATGRIGPVFDRSFYVVLDGQWVCFGSPGLGSGPLNALFAASAPRLAGGQTCHVADGTLLVDGSPLASLTGASIWQPTAPSSWSIDTLDAGLKFFDAPRNKLRARDALGLIDGPGSTPISANLAAAAFRPAHCLAETTRHAFAGGIEAGTENFSGCAGLLGLGPGLTPSGDDVIGGAMIALTMLGCHRLRDTLWASLRDHAPDRTTDLARAHLAAAAEGWGAAPLHATLTSLLVADMSGLLAALTELDAVGHSSGWDSLAGALLVLRSYRDTRIAPLGIK